jgi:hypothetical protein
MIVLARTSSNLSDPTGELILTNENQRNYYALIRGLVYAEYNFRLSIRIKNKILI